MTKNRKLQLQVLIRNWSQALAKSKTLDRSSPLIQKPEKYLPGILASAVDYLTNHSDHANDPRVKMALAHLVAANRVTPEVSIAESSHTASSAPLTQYPPAYRVVTTKAAATVREALIRPRIFNGPSLSLFRLLLSSRPFHLPPLLPSHPSLALLSPERYL